MGKFIVLYGPNNLGKSTQLDLLERVWKEFGRPYARIKYPIYYSDTGRIINEILRGKKEEWSHITDADLQALYALNRREFEPALQILLGQGDVIAEDYVGTGLAWGLVKGVSREELDLYNKNLIRPDVEIMLDGERFGGGIEKDHRHEGAGNEVWEASRRIHKELAKEFGWEVVNANESVEVVHERILEVISRSWIN